jgi:hypothetical protein
MRPVGGGSPTHCCKRRHDRSEQAQHTLQFPHLTGQQPRPRLREGYHGQVLFGLAIAAFGRYSCSGRSKKSTYGCRFDHSTDSVLVGSLHETVAGL